MAGFYPDVPGPRMAYHRDGSTGFQILDGALTVLTATQLQNVNDENHSTAILEQNINWGPVYTYGVIFPELRDIVGAYIMATTSSGFQTSTDTTNGLDGTWTNRTLTVDGLGVASPDYRTEIQSVTWSGVKAFRFSVNGTGGGGYQAFRTLHLYGRPTTGQVRYLMLTDTAGNEVGGAYFDFGDDPRNGSETKQFRVKNGHSTLTANTIGLSFSVLTNKSPSMADDYTFSADNSTYTATLNVGNLGPGASTADLYVKRTTPNDAALGLETGMIVAAATTWT